jgi:transcriptional regulator with XRE-family HTH domain
LRRDGIRGNIGELFPTKLVSCPTELGAKVSEDFQSRFQEALRRRIFPNAPVHLKELAGAIGRAENTVTRWWRGETKITAADLSVVAQFFGQRGDPGFLREIFSDLSGSPSLGERGTVIALARAVLAQAGEFASSEGESDFWFTAGGDVMKLPLDQPDLLRARLKLPARQGDPLSYAVRVLGWVALRECHDGRIFVRHSSRRIAPRAAERVCDWLEHNAARLRHVWRLIETGGQWIESPHPGGKAASAAIAKAAFITRIPRHEWRMKRLPLDSVRQPLLKKLLRVYHQDPAKLVHVAAKIGALTTSSLFGVDGDDVVCHHVGTDLGFDPSVEGLNVLARPDTEYAVALRARVLQAYWDGPAFYELAGMIDDRYARYLNLTLPNSGAVPRVLTSSVVLEVERLSA